MLNDPKMLKAGLTCWAFPGRRYQKLKVKVASTPHKHTNLVWVRVLNDVGGEYYTYVDKRTLTLHKPRPSTARGCYNRVIVNRGK